MDNQQIFDHVVDHLRKQKIRSVSADGTYASCAYRGVDNTKCAIGCLIEDDEYHPSFEGIGVEGLLRRKSEFKNFNHTHGGFLFWLQIFHDREMDRGPDKAVQYLGLIASKFGLNYEPNPQYDF